MLRITLGKTPHYIGMFNMLSARPGVRRVATLLQQAGGFPRIAAVIQANWLKWSMDYGSQNCPPHNLTFVAMTSGQVRL